MKRFSIDSPEVALIVNKAGNALFALGTAVASTKPARRAGTSASEQAWRVSKEALDG